MSEARWWVYMIRTQGGRFYTGITTDIERRFREHRDGRGGARFFRTDPPAEVVYREAATDRSAASRREAELKALPAAAKRALLVNR
jgi:putative endonuclease